MWLKSSPSKGLCVSLICIVWYKFKWFVSVLEKLRPEQWWHEDCLASVSHKIQKWCNNVSLACTSLVWEISSSDDNSLTLPVVSVWDLFSSNPSLKCWQVDTLNVSKHPFYSWEEISCLLPQGFQTLYRICWWYHVSEAGWSWIPITAFWTGRSWFPFEKEQTLSLLSPELVTDNEQCVMRVCDFSC